MKDGTANLRRWLEQVEREFGERIEAIVVGMHDNDPNRYKADRVAPADENAVLSREDGLVKLDQDYDDGLGGPECYPFYAWTASRVFYVSEYDGATSINWVPRNPVPIAPKFSGQN